MNQQEIQSFEEWLSRMHKLMGKGKQPFTKKELTTLEYTYREAILFETVPVSLRQFLNKWHPELLSARADFEPYIQALLENTFYNLIKKLWQIVVDNRNGKKPADIPGLEFETLPTALKNFRQTKPVEKTGNDFKEDKYFNLFSEKDKKEFLDDTNQSDLKSWDYLSRYTREFIDSLQPLFIEIIPELMEMDSEWWLVYEYYFLTKQFDFKFHADRLCNVHEKGLEAKWLDEKYDVLQKKLDEITANK